MKTIIFLFSALVAVVLAKAPLMGRDASDGIPDNYIVVMKKDVDAAAVQNHMSVVEATSGKTFGGHRGLLKTYGIGAFQGYHIECNEETLDRIRNDKLVDYVTRDSMAMSHSPIWHNSLASWNDTPSEALDVPWGLARVSHRDNILDKYVHDDLPGQTYAYILDTGIHTTHKEFGDRARWGITLIEEDNVYKDVDENGHGTHVAATIAGNTVGVDNRAFVIAVKVLSKKGPGPVSGIMKGIEWAVQDAKRHDAINRSVINMSLGCDGVVSPFNDAVKHAVKEGMTVVISSGNSGLDACGSSPSSAEDAITVGCIDDNDRRPEWSNWGTCVDLFAPGINIRSASKDGEGYKVMSGTSMSTPHVVGVITYLMAREPDLTTPQRVKDRILELSTPDKVVDPMWTPNKLLFNGGKSKGNSIVLGGGS